MKKFKFVEGYEPGTERRAVPGVGVVLIDNNLSDRDAHALVEAGAKYIVPVEKQADVSPKKLTENGKETK
jgi:hypothetical protein